MQNAPTKIHGGKTPHRIHYIAEWAEHRQRSQAEIAKATGADKGTVSRWFDGVIPQERYLIVLAGFLEAGEPAALFRHPEEDWFWRFFRERGRHEPERVRTLLDAGLPRRK